MSWTSGSMVGRRERNFIEKVKKAKLLRLPKYGESMLREEIEEERLHFFLKNSEKQADLEKTVSVAWSISTIMPDFF